MDHEIQLFHNDEFGEVRTVLIDGEPWFVGKDVATVLGYKETAKAIRFHVDEEDKGVSILVLLTKWVFRIKKQPTIIIRLNIRYIYLMKRPVHRHFTSLFRLRAHAESRHCSVTRSMPLLRVRVRL